MSGIKTKTVIKYAVMPGIIPRLRALFTSGFGYIAFLMAQIYGSVRLLPANHAYLNPQNIGRYGIRHVIAESANSLIISKKNIDQIAIFILMLTAIVILVLQLGSLAFTLLFGPAFATSLFITPDFGSGEGTYDIAYMLLDQVFGVGNGTNNFFDSCVAQAINCDPNGVGQGSTPGTFPWPFHLALQNLFRFYSMGILIIGTIIFLYFVLVIIVETAATGTPFGQRFKNVWVPIRLVVAVGLLIPLANGYNSGQYVTFAAAKYGSGLATNSWRIYNETINSHMAGGTGNPLGEKENLIAFPEPPDAAVLSEMISLLHACYFSHYIHSQEFVKGTTPTSVGTGKGKIQIDYPETPGRIFSYLNNNYAVKPYLVKTPPNWQAAIDPSEFLEVTQGTSYQTALNFYTRGDIVIRFGRRGGFDRDGDGRVSLYEEELYKEHAGQVEPTCGEIRIPVTDKRDPSTGGTAGYRGVVEVQRMYFELIRDYWYLAANNENYIDFAGRMVLLSSNISNDPDFGPCAMGCQGTNLYLPSCTAIIPIPYIGAGQRECETLQPSSEWRQDAINTLQTEINTRITQIWQNYNAGTTEFDMDVNLLQYGWGGAGIWFNTLAQVNGAFITALKDTPSVASYPMIMEHVASQKDQKDKDATGIGQFDPNTGGANGNQIQFAGFPAGRGIAIDLYNVFEYWNNGHKNMLRAEKTDTGGALETGMNLVFGTHGLFAMTSENANIHPLSQLIALGKGLVESSIRNIAGSSLTAAMGGFAKAINQQAGALVDAASGFLMGSAFIGLTAGFVLFYVLPFLPFVYFFFAVASWIKTIFEAMVGVPLWALAHLRIDGDGLPGESAANGYFLIFEIFIRPILSVAGLIAAMIIFTAQVRVLNFIWVLVTENVGGHNSDSVIGVVGRIDFKRSIVDEFFYTVLYAIIVYLMATTSFKLIDKIPDNILRWMGQGVSSFGDINQDPTENLTRYAAIGGMTAGRQAAGGIKDLVGGTGGAIGGGLARMSQKTPPQSDRRLKENIEHLGHENGIPVYAFSYIGEKQRYKGVMAQDILKIKPEAVVIAKNGYMAVHYDLIGIEMQPLTESAGNDNA